MLQNQTGADIARHTRMSVMKHRSRQWPARVPVMAVVSPAGEVDAPYAWTRARSAQSRQGWAILFERPCHLEGRGCVRACFTRAGGTTHQSCTITMSCCFQLDVRSLHRRCPGTAVIIAGQLRVADHHVREEVRPSGLESGVGLVHVSQVNAMSELVVPRVCPGASDVRIRRGSLVALHLQRRRRSRRRTVASERSLWNERDAVSDALQRG